jgi:hypothetical protein
LRECLGDGTSGCIIQILTCENYDIYGCPSVLAVVKSEVAVAELVAGMGETRNAEFGRWMVGGEVGRVEVEISDSESCPVVGFGITGVEPLDSAMFQRITSTGMNYF